MRQNQSTSSIRPFRAVSALAGALGLALVLAACGGSTAGSAGSSGGSDKTIDVVAVTNVYGSIVSKIGGDRVKVTSIIANTSQDPHSYDSSPQDKLAVSKAGLLIENGGGYDDFFTKLTDGIDKSKLIDVVDLSGLKTAENSADFNEHVWYSLPTIAKLADTVAEKLGALDSAHAADFTANAAKFKTSLADIETTLAGVKTTANGQPVAITEPVPLWMLQSAGLVNKTPEAYSHAIEEGSDVPPAVLKETTDLISSKSVKFLAYNDQTEGPQTKSLKAAAETAGVPVVNFTETLPEGQDYLGWMTRNAQNIAKAVK
ncbi:ABC transporter, solute binding protein [Renibacterium salmoninarum ATCC 33209]|uniref:ABC transporter, solute binding protein n=1 Tax=Renibacterium salmoninarum (strain ATCC 33209 / DSM 20767 / JCM 11484 / NBRC 15589 / NCIMB 2235) TaxID=288705 RepID=A9WPM1_RENSM|nr:zinc ABC transporter substrate-binding protein [Renibacterium salmoninarum]ABY23135.1 ABC transporter, solute binding protein [Renibacterium salmoninarum ATCC 33209]